MEFEDVYRCDRLQTDINPRNRDGGTQCDFSLFAFGQKNRCALRIALEHVYTPYLAARALDRLEVWLLGYRVLLAQLVDALSCVQLGDVIASFKMYWKIALVSYLFYFSSLMVLKGEYKTVAVILILSWILKSPTFQLSCKGRI